MKSHQKEFSIEKRNKLQVLSNRWKINPIVVKQGDEFIIRSTSEFDVWFPPGRNPVKDVSPPGNPPNVKKFKVNEDAKPGEYEFSAFCYDDNKMAEGNSSPRMIIE